MNVTYLQRPMKLNGLRNEFVKFSEHFLLNSSSNIILKIKNLIKRLNIDAKSIVPVSLVFSKSEQKLIKVTKYKFILLKQKNTINLSNIT